MDNQDTTDRLKADDIKRAIDRLRHFDTYYYCESEHDCEKCGYSKYCNIYKIKQENWKTDWEGYMKNGQ